jgi:hypothetical protein
MNFMMVALAYSKNKKALSATGLVAGAGVKSGRNCDRKHANKSAALRAFFSKIDAPGDFGEQRVIAADTDVVARMHARAALAHNNAAGGDEFAAECLDAQAL